MAPLPTIQGVVNAATLLPGPVADGSLIAIFGKNLAAGTTQASAFPLSNTLGGVSIQINGVPAH